MLVTDTVTLGEPRRTSDGYFVIDAKVARTGIQVYSGRELGRPELDKVRVYRSEAEVFNEDAMASFTHKPVTHGHPPVMVSSKNWKQYSRGMTGDTVARDGHFVRVPFTLMDQATIDAVANGERELSNGYVCKIEFTPGITPDGEAYDAQQKDIRGNHLAVVPRGRAGTECRIGDSWDDFKTGLTGDENDATSFNRNPSMKTLVIDGHTVELSDAALIAVSSLQKQVATTAADNLKLIADANAANAEHARSLEAKDALVGTLKAEHLAALGAKDGEIAALKAQVLDAPALDARAEARAILIGQAKVALGATFDAKGKSDVAIQREVVRKALGDGAVDMSDAEIGGAFKVVAGKPAADPLRRVLANPAAPVTDADEGTNAHKLMVQRMSNAWMGADQRSAN